MIEPSVVETKRAQRNIKKSKRLSKVVCDLYINLRFVTKAFDGKGWLLIISNNDLQRFGSIPQFGGRLYTSNPRHHSQMRCLP